LGEDAFMTEEDDVSTPENMSQPLNSVGLDKVQGEWELDDLVQDLQNERSQHEAKKVVSQNRLS